MKRTIVILFLGLAALLWGETVINGSRSILGAWNAGGAASTIPAKVGTAVPATCAVGEMFFDSSAAAGSNIMLCTSANTWTAVAGGGSGGGGQVCAPGDLRYVCVAEEFVGRNTANNSIGMLNWGSSGSISLIAGSWPHLGLYRVATGTSSGNNSAVFLNTASTPFFGAIGNADSEWDVKMVFRVSHTDNITFAAGFGDRNNLNIQAGVGVRNYNGEFAVQWGAGGPQGTPTSTGVPVDTGFHTFRVYTDGTAQKIYTSFDGGTPITFCPSGCTVTVSSGSSFWTTNAHGMPWFAVQTDTSESRSMDIDYFSFRGTVGTTEHAR